VKRKRAPMTRWAACGESRESYEAWERSEFRKILIEAGIAPDLTGVQLVDAMEAAGLVSAAEAGVARASFAALGGGQ
jgi:hypothetical protein